MEKYTIKTENGKRGTSTGNGKMKNGKMKNGNKAQLKPSSYQLLTVDFI